jgi:putative endonuclease
MTKQSIGQEGEELATKYLEARGIKIISRNVKLGGVEADIIAKDGKEIVVVEVKTKTNLAFGLPQEMVGYRKQGQLRKFVAYWMQLHPRDRVRIDVIAVCLEDKPPGIEHLINVVEG